MGKPGSRLRRLQEMVEGLLGDGALLLQERPPRLHRFIHFWVMVGRSFTRNRCPVRASALAYATLLALIPMLAVVISITSTFLKKEGEEKIDQFVGKMVASLVPEAEMGTNDVTEAQNEPTDENQ